MKGLASRPGMRNVLIWGKLDSRRANRISGVRERWSSSAPRLVAPFHRASIYKTCHVTCLQRLSTSLRPEVDFFGAWLIFRYQIYISKFMWFWDCQWGFVTFYMLFLPRLTRISVSWSGAGLKSVLDWKFRRILNEVQFNSLKIIFHSTFLLNCFR